MDQTLARKLPTETLTRRLQRQPFNQTIINELSKRANRVHKCQINARILIEKEMLKHNTKLSLGHKNDAYFTEFEMLSEPIYTFESLSSEEKRIWNNQVKSCKI
jgi:hypothetical protein